MHGFHVALIGVRGGRDAHVLAVTESLGEIALELAAVVGLPDLVAERNAVAIQVVLDAAQRRPRWPKRCVVRQRPRTSSPLRISPAVY